MWKQIFILLFSGLIGFNASATISSNLKQHNVSLNATNFQTESTKINHSNFQIEKGRLLGLTEYGKISPTLTISKDITVLTKNAFNGCSQSLERIIFENLDLWIDPNIVDKGHFVGTPITTQYYTTSKRVYHNLLDLKIDQKKLHMTEVTDDGNFFTINENNNVLNSSAKHIQLLGLTTKCQNNLAITQLFIPLTTTKIASNAFNGCSKSITELTLNTNDEITSFGKDALKETVSVINYFTNNEQSAINLINSGFQKKVTVKLAKYIEQKLIVVVFNEYQKNDFIIKEQKNKSELLRLTNVGKTIASILTVPGETTFISIHTFLGCQAQTLDFTQIVNSNQITIEKSAFIECKSIKNYLVLDDQMKQKLINAGVTNNKIKCVTTLVSNFFSYVLIFLGIVFSFFVTLFWLVFRRKHKKFHKTKTLS